MTLTLTVSASGALVVAPMERMVGKAAEAPGGVGCEGFEGRVGR
ncbi:MULTISPECIES: hypothetical protein [Streptomyces]|nr:hypothetical protein [Streptomyces venezuelae]